MPDRRPVAPFSGAGGPVGRGWCRSSARRRHGAIRQEWQGQTAGQRSIGLAGAIENPICNPARHRLTWKGPSDRASAGRATPVAAPAPLGSNLCFRRDADTPFESRTQTASTWVGPSSPAGGFRLLAGLPLWGIAFRILHICTARAATAGARHPLRRFAARIRTSPPARGLSFPTEQDL